MDHKGGGCTNLSEYICVLVSFYTYYNKSMYALVIGQGVH